jgi:hypothetical protein
MSSFVARTSVIALTVASMVAAPAFAAVPAAARLASIDGPVLVDQGAGFAPVSERTVLRAGDRILSLRGAHARLIYANGCAVQLKGGAMLVVAVPSNCGAARAMLVSDTDFTGDQAQAGAGAAGATGGGAGAGAAAAAGGAAVTSGVAGLSIGTLAVVGAGAVAVGVGVAAATGSFSTSP